MEQQSACFGTVKGLIRKSIIRPAGATGRGKIGGARSTDCVRWRSAWEACETSIFRQSSVKARLSRSVSAKVVELSKPFASLLALCYQQSFEDDVVHQI